MTDVPRQKHDQPAMTRPVTSGGRIIGALACFIHCHWAIRPGPLLLAGLLAAARPVSGEEPRPDPAAQVREIELRGRVVCLAEAIFSDDRVRQKELLVKARLFPGTRIIELTNLHSVKHGVVQDLYYYCDVCAIKAVAPEPCGCCQGPVRLVEEPLSDRKE